MIINNSFLYKKQETKPTFKADYFQPIKNLPNITCAYCGKKTLSIEKYIQSLLSISLPLKEQVEKGVLNYLKDFFPKTWEKIINLSKTYPQNTLDEITHNKNAEVNDNYIELKKTVIDDIKTNNKYENLDKREMHRFINKTFFDVYEFGRSYMKPSSIAIKELEPIASYLDGSKKEVFEQLKSYSLKYPDKSLSEIICEPEVVDFHLNEYAKQKKEKWEKLNFHLKNILKIIKEKNPKALPTFQYLQNQALKTLYTTKGVIKRKYLIENMYKEALKKHSNSKINEKDIINELRQIPETFITKDNFFVEAANRKFKDIEIINSLFGSILTSEKHIVELDKGGIDEIGNKKVVCRGCNTRSKSLSYDEEINYYPEMPQNTQKQMNYIISRILNNDLNDKLKRYPIYASRNYKIASDGKLKLNLSDYFEKDKELHRH